MVFIEEGLWDPQSELQLTIKSVPKYAILLVEYASGAEASEFYCDIEDCKWLISKLNECIEEMEADNDGE
jgi:hypothetical protein